MRRNESYAASSGASAEFVLRLAKKNTCRLHQATIDVRESKNAHAFRNWCAQFASLEQNNRPAAKAQIEMLAQIYQVCKVWRDDVKEGVNYKTRKINLEHLPIIGGVLKALNPDLSAHKNGTRISFFSTTLRP